VYTIQKNIERKEKRKIKELSTATCGAYLIYTNHWERAQNIGSEKETQTTTLNPPAATRTPFRAPRGTKTFS